MKNLLLISMLVLSVSAFGQDGEEPRKNVILSFDDPEKMFRILEGKWIFDDMKCDEPYTVTVAKDRKSIKFTYAKPEKMPDGTTATDFTYRVLAVGKYYIRTQIEGEKRRTDDGKAVKWDFWFFSRDEFRWRRTDWKTGATPPVTRCREAARTVASLTN